jgi:uncharacterized phage protein (TIGR02218 family)
MSYATIEPSVNQGQPVELYLFVRGSESFRFCTFPDGITYLSNLYTHAAISRDKVKQNTDPFKNDIKFTFPRTNLFALSFLQGNLEDITTVTIYRGHIADNDFKTYWKGRVLGCETTENAVDILCESVYTSLRRIGVRARYEYTCRHALYSSQCGANKASFDAFGAIDTVINNGMSITISEASSQVDGYYTAGFLEVNGIRRFITNHIGSQLDLLTSIDSTLIGQTATIYAGCDHLRTTCNSKFNNLDNFGGFPFIPSKNPFIGSPY